MLTEGRRLVILALVGLGLASTAPAAAQTVDDLVRRYVEARGGASRLRAVESLRMRGMLELGDVRAPYVLELKRPNRMRSEFVVNGQTAVRAFDGREAWERLPLPGEPARPMAADEAAEARAQADVDLSPLVDAAAKGFAVELVGRGRLPQGETWTLVVRGRDGPPRTLQLDVKSHLVVQTIDVRTIDGKPVEMVTEVSDYRAQGGVLFPHRIEVGPRGSSERQRLLIETVELNPPLDDAHFAMPDKGRDVPVRGRASDAVLP